MSGKHLSDVVAEETMALEREAFKAGPWTSWSVPRHADEQRERVAS